MEKTKVYIVGAGPGDEGLITLRALECIEGADVILYDELANSSLLDRAKEDAEIIYVGKKAGDHSLPQEDIGKLLVEKAGSGKTVCRLKGGDPFVFGRGGEEAELLSKNGIEFEIVPGVSSAVAAPAYAGIPVTHRGLSSGVAIFTGHEDPKKDTSDLNWKSIARLKTTLVFVMGMKNLPAIVDKLIREGLDSKTPVAIIHRGTTPAQKTVRGELSNIVQIAEKTGMTAPSVIIIGKVAALRDELAWFEKRPLYGRSIMVTRTRKQASTLVKGLKTFGANVYEFPTIEIEPNSEALPELDNSIKTLSGYDWVCFTSANGVEIFFERVRSLGLDSRIMSGVKVCVIGPATRDKLAEYFITADLMPEKYIAESILEAFGDGVKGKRILLPRADIARDALPGGLLKTGAEVKVIDIYKTKPASGSADVLKKLLDEVDLVTFTSSSTVENFVKILGASNMEGIKAASIGPITTETIKNHGLTLACEAKEFNIQGLIEAVLKYYME